MYIQGTNSGNGLGDLDFGSIVDKLVSGYAAYSTTKAQTDLAKAQIQAQQAQAQAQQNALLYQLSPQYTGNYSTGAAPSSNLMPILLIGGAALLMFFMLKD